MVMSFLQLAENARQAAIRIAGAVTYGQFKKSVGDAVGKEIGWNQVSALFNITRRAMQVAGASGALAVQIKEMSLRYFEDTFANWIVGQGGWVSYSVPPSYLCIIWASMQENLSSGFQTKRDSNQSPQLQRLARKLKSCLKQVWILYFPISE